MQSRRVTAPSRPVFGRPATPGRQRSSRPGLWRNKRLWQLVAVVVVVMGVWSLFGIKSLNVTGTTHLDTAKLQTAADLSLRQRPWSHNLLTLDEGGLRHDLMTADYRVKSVTLARHWPGHLEVQLQERQPSLNWKTGDQTYILDLDGSLIGPASGETANLPTIVDSTNLPVKVGDKVVPPHFVQFCTDIIGLMPKRTGIGVSGLKVPDTTSEVYVMTNKGYLIKFDTTREASGEVDDLVNVLVTLSKLKKTPAEYIDLRVENKAYYR